MRSETGIALELAGRQLPVTAQDNCLAIRKALAAT
jgi:hypothetical protein